MYSSRKLYTLHSNRNIYYSVLCSIPITPPPISIWVELDKKAKKLSSFKYIHRTIQPKRNDNLGNAAQDDAPSRMPSYRPIHPDSIAAPYDIRLLEHRQIGNMAVKSRPAPTECRVLSANGESPESRDTLGLRRPVRAASYRM